MDPIAFERLKKKNSLQIFFMRIVGRLDYLISFRWRYEQLRCRLGLHRPPLVNRCTSCGAIIDKMQS